MTVISTCRIVDIEPDGFEVLCNKCPEQACFSLWHVALEHSIAHSEWHARGN